MSAAFLAATLAGCTRTSPETAPTLSTDSAVSRAADATDVRFEPDFLEASRRFAHGDRAGSRTLLSRLKERLGKEASLTPVDAAFLDRQILLCSHSAPLAVSPTAPAPGRTLASADCGPRALAFVARKLGVSADVAALKKAAGTDVGGTTMAGLKAAAASIGLSASGVQVDTAALQTLASPAIAWVDGDHYIALLAVERASPGGAATCRIHDPNRAHEEQMSPEELRSRSGGILLLVERAPR